MNDRDCDNCAHHSEGGCSVWECSFERKKDDLISRQAAVDAICGECQANCIPCEYFPCGEIKAIQALPPAQPNLQPTCNQLATDCISRQAAIDALDKEYRCTDKSDDWDGLETAMLIIENLSSAQSEPSTEIQEILNYLDTTLHPIVSPDNWDVYAELYDMVSRLPFAQPEIIHCGDCKYKDDGIDEDGIPFLKCLNGRSYGGTRINDYCSWAERREE